MHHSTLEHAIDAGAVSILAGVLFGFLSHATIVLTFLWALGRLYEMATGVKVHETKTIQAALRRIRAWLCG